MKIKLLIIFLLFVFKIGFAQENVEIVVDNSTLEDSIRLKFDISDSIKVLTYENNPHSHVYVFIDYNRDSKLYKRIENSNNITDNILSYTNELFSQQELKTNDSISLLLHSEYNILLKHWVELYSLDSELYVISACDYTGEYYLTNSLFYDAYYMDIPRLSIIESVTKISDNNIRIELKTLQNKQMTLDFYEVDSRGTYLVVLSGKFDNDIIYLMTTRDMLRNYKLIYHDCSDITGTYKFDTIDYEMIIKELKN